MNEAEKIRGEASAVRAAADLRRGLGRAYREGRAAAERGDEVPDDMYRREENGSPEAFAWLEGYHDAAETFGEADPECPDCNGTSWAHNAWLDRLSVCHCSRHPA